MLRAARTRTARHTIIAYNSCRNRHCPKCQGAAAREWLAEREAELLPVPYFHVVYTLPAPIADIAYQNKRVIYDLLFKASAESTLTIAGRPQASGRQDRHHCGAPHLGLGHDASSARAHDRAGRRSVGRRHHAGSPCRPNFFLPVRVLSRLFRRLFLQMLAAAHGRPAEVLRRSHGPRRHGGIRRLPRAPQADGVGGLRQEAVRRARGGAAPICRATPTASPSPTAASSRPTRRASPSAARTTASCRSRVFDTTAQTAGGP